MSSEFKGTPSGTDRESKIIEENEQRVALYAAHEVACSYIRTLGEKHQKLQQECVKEMDEALKSVAKMDQVDRTAGWQLNPQAGFWFKLLPPKPEMGPDGVAKSAEVVGSIAPSPENAAQPSAEQPNADAGEMASEQAGAEKEGQANEGV